MMYTDVGWRSEGEFDSITVSYYSEWGNKISKKINVKFENKYLENLIKEYNINVLPFLLNNNKFELRNVTTDYTVYVKNGIVQMYSMHDFATPHSLEELYNAVFQLFEQLLCESEHQFDFIKTEALRSGLIKKFIGVSNCNFDVFFKEIVNRKDCIISSFDKVEISALNKFNPFAGSSLDAIYALSGRMLTCTTNYMAIYSKEYGYIVTMDQTVCKLNPLCDEIKENYNEPFEEIDDRLNNSQKDRYLNEYGEWREKV